MNYEILFGRAGERTIRAGLVGAGEFGSSFLFQARRVKGLEVPLVITRTPERAIEAWERAGVPREEITVAESEGEVKKAFEQGRKIVLAEGSLAAGLPLDVLVEGSGHPEAGAGYAEMAIESGWHLIMVSKEVDSVIGPELAARAGRQGLVYSQAEGDQPSLLIGLISWARVLGLEVLAAGKSSEYDFVFDPAARTVTSNRVTVEAAGLEKLWHLGQRRAAEVVRERSGLLAALPQRAVPDLCEMGLVANATGFRPDRPCLHAPVARTVEIPDLLCPASRGGLLEGEEVLDIVNCLRRPDEASLGGGVFIVVRVEDEATWRVLEAKGHPLDRGGRQALLYHPAHLLGVETPVSILAAALLGQPTGGERPRPVCDLAGRARQDLPAGTLLAMGGHHHLIEGVEAELVEAAPARGDNPIPFYLMANRRLKEEVRAGELITVAKVEAKEGSVLARLRAEQDRRFFS